MKHFQQYEFELAISRLLGYGDIERIAEKVGKGSGLMGQYFDPNNERQSNLYRAAEVLAAMVEMDEELGCKALETFCHFVQRAKQGKDLCVNETRERAYREDFEAKLAEASGASLDVIIKEYEDDLRATAEHLEAMRAKKRREIKADVFDSATVRLNGNGKRLRRVS